MQAIEFKTFILDEKIELPVQFRGKIKGQARVIVLADEEDEEVNYLDYLMDNPIQISNFKPLTRDEIYSGKRFGD